MYLKESDSDGIIVNAISGLHLELKQVPSNTASCLPALLPKKSQPQATEINDFTAACSAELRLKTRCKVIIIRTTSQTTKVSGCLAAVMCIFVVQQVIN